MKNASLLIHPDELSYRWIDRMTASKIPTLAFHPPGGKNADETMADLLNRLEDPEYRKMLDYGAEKGLKYEYEMHAARYLLPASEFENHPEWFRVNEEGVRTPDYNCCASSEEALDYIAEKAAEAAKKLYRNTHRYFFWLDDIKGARCDCPRCREMSSSDQAMTILNRMLRGIRRVNPRAKLCYLAYIDIIAPPKFVRPDEGIFLEYAPINRDLSRPISDPTCEKNVAEAQHLAPLLSYFGTKDAQVLEYWMDNSLNCRWKLPYRLLPFYPEVIAQDVAYYRGLGFEHVTSFGCFLGEDYAKEFGIPPVKEYAGLI